ncbi:MAG: DUF3987 domain-containing protein [Verrucomicrobiales bacterium]
MNRNFSLLDNTSVVGQHDADLPSGPPAMLDRAALPRVVGDLIGKILPLTEAGEAALLINFLSTFGSMAGRNRYTSAGRRHYPNLFGVLCGATSKGRKGTSWSAFKNLIPSLDECWSQECLANGLNSGEGLIYHVRDASTDKKGNRVDGVSDKRILVIEEEFAAILKRMKGQTNSLSAVLRDAWDGNDLRSMTRNSPDRATAPHISVVAHITKAEASDLLTGTDCENGFANRFLWVYAERSKFLPEAGEISPDHVSQEIAILKAALDQATSGGEREIPLSPTALELWHTVYRELSDGKPGLFGAVIGRAEAHVRRLALCYSLLLGEEKTSETSLRAGLALWRYCDQTAGWIFGTPFNHPDADKIYNALRHRPEGMTRTEMNRVVFANHATKTQLDKALEILQKAGAAFPTKLRTGGADREIWKLTGTAK